ncbi:MAG: type II toxin-antitoxin system VapC family toxin [Oxalobacteraceae bacterium]|nr:type II toxin-antitoxin system VapC family toxin [Oxalobacteraceae bacterium]
MMPRALPGVLLDTNVLSELMRARPNAAVLAWFEQQSGVRFYTSAITRAEILLGIALLPAGKRRVALAAAAEQMFEEDFASHCLPFDAAAASEYALLVAARTRIGHAISTEDALIAAIAIQHQMPLVTRNTKDFVHIGQLKLINPWMTN